MHVILFDKQNSSSDHSLMDQPVSAALAHIGCNQGPFSDYPRADMVCSAALRLHGTTEGSWLFSPPKLPFSSCHRTFPFLPLCPLNPGHMWAPFYHLMRISRVGQRLVSWEGALVPAIGLSGWRLIQSVIPDCGIFPAFPQMSP